VDKIPLLGLSDPLVAPTGFGRGSRELFVRIPQDLFRLAYISTGWAGSSRFPGIQTYAETRSTPGFDCCQTVFPYAVTDFTGPQEPFILWTLLDPWQTSWISHPTESPIRSAASEEFLSKHRDRFKWIGYFPIDGTGPRPDHPPRWIGDIISQMDYPVAMSRWGQKLCNAVCSKEIRVISHAVNIQALKPVDRSKARESVQGRYYRTLAATITEKYPEVKIEQVVQEADSRTFRFDQNFVVICVMANRARKYWWEVLQAFKLLLVSVPNARLIGICSSRHATEEDMTPLIECCHDLELRLDNEAHNPNVWLIESVVDRPGVEDQTMSLLYNCADCAVLLSGGEGFGLPQLEAHACGIPCIVGDYSASTELAVSTRELVSPRGFYHVGSNQTRRPIYSPKDIADRLIYAAQNQAWCQETGQLGIAQASERSWEKVLPQWTDLFAEVAAGISSQREERAGAQVV